MERPRLAVIIPAYNEGATIADIVGRERVIAGSDCGFGGRSHPQVAWAKLESMVAGAALASKALGKG